MGLDANRGFLSVDNKYKGMKALMWDTTLEHDSAISVPSFRIAWRGNPEIQNRDIRDDDWWGWPGTRDGLLQHFVPKRIDYLNHRKSKNASFFGSSSPTAFPWTYP